MRAVLLQLLGPVLAAVVMALGAWALRRSLRRVRGRKLSDAKRTKLLAWSQRYDRKTLGPTLLALFVTFVVVVPLVTIGLDQLAALWVRRHAETIYVIDPVTQRATWLKWVMPHGLLAGFAVLWFITEWFMSRRYSRWWLAKYRLAGNYRFGCDYVRAIRTVMGLLAALSVPLAVLQADWYTRVDDRHFVVNEFWGLGETPYRFDQIDKIVMTAHLHTKTGEVVTRNRLFLVFTDGYQWCLDPPLEYDDWLGYVCKKSGKPVTRARFIEDVVGP